MAQVPFKGVHHEDGIVPGRESRVVWSDQLEAHVAEGPQQGACGGERELELGSHEHPRGLACSTREWPRGSRVVQVSGGCALEAPRPKTNPGTNVHLAT